MPLAENNMSEIIPSINVPTFTEIQERIRKVEPYVKWCHLDVTDGIFSKYETWRNPADLSLLDTTLNIEVHLMVSEPEKVIDQWLVKPVKRLIVHLETAKDMELLIDKCRKVGVEIGLAVNPETPGEALAPWLGKVDLVQVLAVHPGSSGQKSFWPELLGKISYIREQCRHCIIEADGGINPETARKAAAAGADLLVSGAYIFNNQNFELTLEELARAVKI